MAMQLTFLGTGTSAGVPMIGCDCAVCASDDPRDHRGRSSVLIRYDDPTLQVDETHRAFNPAQTGRRQLLIDATPELRLQAVAQRLSRLDGVLITHAHADHVYGIDDLRRFNAVMGGPIDIHAEAGVIQWLRVTFSHIFESHKNPNASFVANLIAHPLVEGVGRDLFGTLVTPLRLLHGRLPIFGYRFDHGGRSIAYCTDVSSIPPETWPRLEGLDVLVIDALRYRHHPTHMTVDRALEVARRVTPGQTFFTHIAHDISHADLSERLPPNVALAYDGLVVELD